MAEKVKLSVSVSAELGAALRECAEADDVQLSTVVSRALEEYLDKRRTIRAGMEAMEEHFEEHGWPTPEAMSETEARIDALFGEDREERRSA
jgi:predicted transcriptional regulator